MDNFITHDNNNDNVALYLWHIFFLSFHAYMTETDVLMKQETSCLIITVLFTRTEQINVLTHSDSEAEG